MHRLLERQLKKLFGDRDSLPAELSSFLEVIDCAYREFDGDRIMLERSLELSSRELMQANSEMRAIFKTLPDLFFRLDRDGRILDCKGGGTDDFAIPPEDLLGKCIQDIPNSGVRTAFQKAIVQVQESRTPVSIEYSLTLGGKEAYYEARLLPVLEDQVIVIVRNITERKESAEELAQQRAFLRQVIDLNPDIIFAKDREGRFTLVNQALADAYDTTVEAMLGQCEADFNPDRDEISKLRREDLEVLEYQREIHNPEVSFHDAGGKLHWLQTIKRPIVSSDGHSHQLLCVASDVTKRKMAEEELRKRTEELLKHQTALHDLTIMVNPDFETRLRKIVSTAEETIGVARVGVWLYDEERTKLVSECLYEFGWFKDVRNLSLEAKSYPRYFGALENSRTIAAHDALNDSRTSEFAEGYLKPLGITSMLDVSVRIRGSVVGVVCLEHIGPARKWTSEEQHFSASIADLVSLSLEAAKRMQLEGQLRQSHKMEAIGVLAGGIAHDFNNLLTAILGYCDYLIRSLDGEEPARTYAQQIMKAGDLAASLTRQLLAFGRKQVLDPKIVDLGSVVMSIEQMLRRIIGEDINLRTVHVEDLGSVKVDPGQIEQVVMNLAINARDAMPSGGEITIKTANIEIDPSSSLRHPGIKAGQFVALDVSDTGCGMDVATKSRIFEPFFTTKERGKGTGLGLSTVYGIIKQSGGDVWVNSEPGVGTSFRVLLPRLEETSSDRVKRRNPEEDHRGTETILIVEDEEQIRVLACMVLREEGYLVLEAPDGLEALQISERYAGSIDMLVTDVVMPHLNGHDVADRMTAMRPAMKVLYMSGYTDDAIVPRGILLPVTPFLQKPFTPDALSAKIRQMLDECLVT